MLPLTHFLMGKYNSVEKAIERAENDDRRR